MLLVGALLLPLASLRAADDTPAAIAEREAAEEREKRINARMEDMEKTVQSYEKRISALHDDLRSLRDEINKLRESNNDSQTKESIKRLKDAVEEVDKKRLDDNKKVMEALEELQGFIKKNLTTSTSVKPPPTTTTKSNHTTPKVRRDTEQAGYEYTVADKDTLLVIISKLRTAKNIRVTQKQMMDANPDVNWKNLQIGQKLFVPAQ